MIREQIDSVKSAIIWVFVLVTIYACLCTAVVYADDLEYDVSVDNDGSVKVLLQQDSDEYYNAIVTGTGAMKDCARPNQWPWYTNYRQKIKSVTVESGITDMLPPR